MAPNDSGNQDDDAVLLSELDIGFVTGQQLPSSADLAALRRGVLFDAQVDETQDAPAFLKRIHVDEADPVQWPEDEIWAIKEMPASARQSAVASHLKPDRWDVVIEDLASTVLQCRNSLTVEDEQTELRLNRKPRYTRGFSPPLRPSDIENPGKTNENIWPISMGLHDTTNHYLSWHSDHSGSMAIAWRLARANLNSRLAGETLLALTASPGATAKRTLYKPLCWMLGAIPAGLLVFINQPTYLCAYLLLCLIFSRKTNSGSGEPDSLRQYRLLASALETLNHGSNPTSVHKALKSIDQAADIATGFIRPHDDTLHLVRDLLAGLAEPA
ncbi:hypothetical protein [Parahaliea aestuarii]|uniref:Uncharacterized protein n=1 Tax=Parahaliea aestuarii TaxID=1852021 RepID=A0A5C9A483_9GAMM|nr:hypothetical protein [Parahaliea aestuarii]TXS94447.1 hypothetical protein FVW59_00570 [Parahaliea aestuarii]